MKKHISILLPNLRCGGAERVTVNLANGFIKRGYAVDMVLLSAKGEFLVDLLPEVRVIDLKVNRMRGLLFPLIRYILTQRPTTFLACMWPLSMIAILACKLSCVDVRLVVVEHTTWSRDIICKSRFKRWQVATSMHYIFPSARDIVTVSQGAADDLARFANLCRDDVKVIYNPVVGESKPDNTSLLPPQNWWLGPHRKVLAVGTLTAIKDYFTLLKAFAQLRQKVDARLLILGEGESRTSLETYIKNLGLEGSVFLPGFIKDPSPYYKQADLHVLSSKGEGLPTVIIEALAAGTPVVSTDCLSGPREILCDGRYGHLVPVGDSAALALAMAESLNSKYDPAILKLRAHDFSIDKAVTRYESILFS